MQSLKTKINFLSKVFGIATAFAIPISTTLTQILFIVTPILVILSGDWQQKWRTIVHNRIAILFFLFFLLLALGMTYSSVPIGDSFSRLIKFDKFFLGIFFIPIFVDEKWRKLAIQAFLVAVGIILIISYLRYFGLIHYVGHRSDDLVEVFKGHIAFSFLLSFAAYFILLQFSESKSKTLNILLSIFMLLIAYNIFFLGIGRAGYFIFASLVILFFVQKFNFKKSLLAVLIIIVIAGIAFFASKTFHSRTLSIFSDVATYQNDENTSIGLRMSFAKNSLKIIAAHPLIGTGTGSVQKEYANVKPTPAYLTKNPHNEYLNIGIQLGMVGILFLLYMFFSQLKLSLRLPWQMKCIAQATVIAIMLGSLANSWLMDITTGYFYVYFSIVAFACLSSYKTETKKLQQ